MLEPLWHRSKQAFEPARYEQTLGRGSSGSGGTLDIYHGGVDNRYDTKTYARAYGVKPLLWECALRHVAKSEGVKTEKSAPADKSAK